MEREISNLNKALERTEKERALEEEIFGSEEKIGYQEKIKDFAVLLNSHKLPVNFLNFLERNTHPKVWFSNLNLNLEKNVLDISGYAENFGVLGQQTTIFKNQDFIKNINLSWASLDKEGKVNFNLQLTLDPKIFK